MVKVMDNVRVTDRVRVRIIERVSVKLGLCNGLGYGYA